ncbi:MAG: radical SAM protein [Candidatus Aenigmarchaeota archaeon]|nr:radical SAM protein [Candidatus Aenigmarchaeota archaeon]
MEVSSCQDQRKLRYLDKVSSIVPKVRDPGLKGRLGSFEHALSCYNEVGLRDDPLPAEAVPRDKDFVRDAWKVCLERSPNHHLSLYIHIPFCLESRCKYCREYSTILEDRKELVRYLDYLTEEMQFFSPVFLRNIFSNLYIGGGTSSIFSSEQLDILYTRIHKYLQVDTKKECTVEMSPSTATKEKVDLVKRHGFNRISLGIQSLDEGVLRENNRIFVSHTRLKDLFDYIRSRNIGCLSADLLLGLTGDTEKSLLRSIEGLINLGPDAIVLIRIVKNPVMPFPMDPLSRANLFRKLYLNQRENVNIGINYPVADYSILEVHKKAESLLESCGYIKKYGGVETIETHFFKEGKGPHFENYNLDQYNEQSVLGLGIGAASKVGYGPYYADITNIKSDYSFKTSVYYCKYHAPRDQMRMYLRSKLFSQSQFPFISIPEFRRKFKTELLEEFGEEIDVLKWLGLGVVHKDELILSPRDDYDRVLMTRIF